MSSAERVDMWYSQRALRLYEIIMGQPAELSAVVKLIHPEGRSRFARHGVVFIDTPIDRNEFFRFCVLFPGQKMRMHHHKERAEMFKVLAGTVLMVVDKNGLHDLHAAGGFMTAPIDAPHGVANTDSDGAIYAGICHAVHMTDVLWEDADVDWSTFMPIDADDQPAPVAEPTQRLTIVPNSPSVGTTETSETALTQLMRCLQPRFRCESMTPLELTEDLEKRANQDKPGVCVLL